MCSLMMYKLITIREALTAPWPSAGTGGQYVDTSPAFLEQLAASEPTYLKEHIKAHDPQGALYWFGKTERFGKHAGPAFMLHMIRLSVIVEIIFVVLIFNAIPFVLDEDKSYIGVIIAMILPTLAVNIMAPQRMLTCILSPPPSSYGRTRGRSTRPSVRSSSPSPSARSSCCARYRPWRR